MKNENADLKIKLKELKAQLGNASHLYNWLKLEVDILQETIYLNRALLNINPKVERRSSERREGAND